MTPVSLNPPGPNSLLQGQNQFINFSPINQDPPTLFNLLGGDYTDQDHDHHQDHGKLIFEQDGSSSNNHEQVYNNSSSDPSSARDTNLSSSLEEESGHGSEKWMSSKMRLMKKMINTTTATTDDATKTPIMRSSNNSAADKQITTTPMMNPSNYLRQRSPHSNNSGGNNIIRVCSDCNTTTTPLWRSGPMGPKSLCNACGIRQRKARRAMAEAANGLATPTKTNKEKKPRVNNSTQFKKKSNSITTTTPTTSAGSSSQDVKKLESYALNLRNNSDFEDMFPSDEATEAALLLMRISSGKLFNLN
ncbi:putative GATA transcription factor 22 [Trifolium pratense]|nr:putative GATA transcription factor 22 [Trifolium pratense]